jgi:hypothetical protein
MGYLPHATWPFEFRKRFPGEINNKADANMIPALDGGRSTINECETKPNHGWIGKYSGWIAAPAPADAGVSNRGTRDCDSQTPMIAQRQHRRLLRAALLC